MKVRVFQSDKGDCLLLTSRAGANVLVDGGMADAFTRPRTRPFSGGSPPPASKLDLVYVSHIDQDHISGVLQAARQHDGRGAYTTSAGKGPQREGADGAAHAGREGDLAQRILDA